MPKPIKEKKKKHKKKKHRKSERAPRFDTMEPIVEEEIG